MGEVDPSHSDGDDAADGMGPQPDAEPDRQAQPVDAEQPPRLEFPVVGIGASAGGLEAVSDFLAAMPADGGMAFVLVQHLPPDRHSMMAEILSKKTSMPVREVEDGLAVEVNHVYVIRPGHVLTIREGHLHLGPRLDGPRAANRPVDDFFKSLAEEQRERAIAIIMSGMGSNGAAGAQAVKAVGGLCVAQEPESALFPSMPRHLIDAGLADYILRPGEMPDVLLAYAGHPYARGGRELSAASVLRRDHANLRDILSVLRTRTRQEFNGYKKPTVLRRVQRRMGLARITMMDEYVKLLRQSPAEVTALADDLLIHVTGFFRDPEAWEALRERVIVPLVAGREPEGEIRCWVTACSTGDEAYSLAILLSEEAERAHKRLDIKVFATDMAERTLSQARAGVYPGGIEAEVSPERLGRYFVKEDAVYRVRPDLRERVVFAPQNVLQDPPFSRLDIASCRNLLIYLEPDVQQRVLGLLHFGLREGGALFLGTSETISSVEGMFEPIDKKAKIFRRVGPTRHGSIDFPLPRALRSAPAGAASPPVARLPVPRATFAQITQRVLLEHHLPAAVLVDRDYRIQYYQGDTRPFLGPPRGEPTRELMELALEGVRGAIRVALSRAATEDATKVTDGWVETEPGRRTRVGVTASRATAAGMPDHFVVSFELRPEDPVGGDGNGDGDTLFATDELRRVREELQSTVEELQTANEEMKAASEETSSINEELQSSNEELETSKEEMQSLNEELTTVNAQLQAKAEEHQATSNDLASLLASTDIAVLFLDPRMRIRRFTPPVRDLIDLMQSDLGRPLSDLARKFDDPHLTADAEAVLARLVPVEREVAADGGRWYLRRVTPYRTADNRIDGTVVAFVDITARRRAEEALRASEEQFRRAIEDAPIPVIMQAEDGQVLQVSRTWTELTGYGLADVPTAEAWLSRAYGRGADAVRGHMHELFKGSIKTLDVEFAIRTRRGVDRHWSFSASAPGTLHDGRRYLVGMAVDITDRRRAEEALRESEREVTSQLSASQRFHALSARLLGGGDREGVLAEVLQIAADAMDTDFASLQTLEPGSERGGGEGDGLTLRLRAHRGFHPDSAAFWERVEADGTSSCGRVLATGERAVIEDVEAAGAVAGGDLDSYRWSGIRAVQTTPLLSRSGRLLGAISTHWRHPHRPSARQLESFDVVARQAADLIERAQVDEALQASETRQAFLLELSDALRHLSDPVAIEVEATRVLGEHLRVDRALYAEVEPDEDHILIHRDFTAAGAASIAGRQKLSSFGSHWVKGYRAGRTIATSDFRDIGGSRSAAFEAVGVRACVGVPVNKNGKFVGVLIVHSAAPREWTPLEVTLTEETAERTWAAVERANAEAAARESQEQLRLAFLVARMGTWEWDVARNRHTRDENLSRLLGLEPVNATVPLDEFLSHLHPADVPAVRAAFDASARDRRPLHTEFRVVWPDGTVHWLQDRGEVFARDGAPYIVGACIDVTERRRAEAALRDSEERLRLVVEGARDFAMLLMDETGRITAWNTGAERLLGFTEGEAVGQNCSFIFTPEDRAAGAPEQERAQAATAGRAVDERWHVRKGADRFWGSGVMTTLRNPDGSVRGFVKVLRDETARKEVEDATQAAKDAAELANRVKDEFLATLSHELRTPLSAILLWVKVLDRKGKRPAPAQLAEGLVAIRSSAEAQRTLIEDLLDTSRITSGKLRLQPRRVSLPVVVREAVDAVLPAAEARGVTIAADLDPAAGDVSADPDRLRQVVWNLLTNAVKFTPANGRVEVGLWRRGAEVEIRVADTGQGIDPAFLPQVFDPFRQADGSSTRRYGGLGLGLAICKQLIELHGGTIRAESPGPGRGATFIVRLPLPRLRGGKSPKAAAGTRVEPPAASAAGKAAGDLSGVRVLLVEDERDTRNALAMFLREAGAAVTAVDSAAAALEAFAQSRPDVLLSDISMPDTDGYALLRQVRGQEAAGAAPVPAIAVTAFARDEDRQRALDAGFQHYFSKPVEPDELLAAVGRLAGASDGRT